MPLRIALIGAALLVAFSAFILIAKRPPAAATAPVSHATVKPIVPKVIREGAISSMSVEDLRGLVEVLRKEKGSKFSELEVLMDEGETVVTDGYESSPGSFVFSTVTPFKTTFKDGSPGLKIAVKRFSFEVGGKYSTQYDNTVPLSPKAKSTVRIGDDSDKDWSHKLILRGEASEAGKIRLQMTEEEEYNPSLPASAAPKK